MDRGINKTNGIKKAVSTELENKKFFYQLRVSYQLVFFMSNVANKQWDKRYYKSN